MKKLLLLLLVCSVAEAKPKYRLRGKIVNIYENGKKTGKKDTLYIPQIKKIPSGFYLFKQWVDIANQPLHDKRLAEELINEVRVVDETIRQTQIINIKLY
jgi:hypothetical protein